MILFHGTSASNLASIQSDGIKADSYWGTFEQASHWASSFDDGIILKSDIDEADLRTSLLMAESLFENGDIDDIPDESDFEYSIEYLGGCVCIDDIFDFSVV